MQTADWALVISLCSAGVSLASFIWNVWSKFIYPKPVVQVSFQMMRSIYPAQGVVGGQVLALIATNMGPAQVTLRTAICRRRKRFPFLKTRSFFLLSPIPNYPQDTELSIGPFAGGLPKKLELESSSRPISFPITKASLRGKLRGSDLMTRSAHCIGHRGRIFGTHCLKFERPVSARARTGKIPNRLDKALLSQAR